MDAKMIAKIALRVLATYIVATGIMGLPQLLSIPQRNDDTFFLFVFIFFLFLVVAPLIVGVALWMLAPKMAGWAVGKVDPATSDNPVKATDLQAMAFMTVGLIFTMQAAWYIAGIVYATVLESTSPGNNPSLYHTPGFYSQIAKLVFGIVLIVGAKSLTRLFQRFREFGSKQDT